jgi:hypothetical protein
VACLPLFLRVTVTTFNKNRNTGKVNFFETSKDSINKMHPTAKVGISHRQWYKYSVTRAKEIHKLLKLPLLKVTFEIDCTVALIFTLTQCQQRDKNTNQESEQMYQNSGASVVRLRGPGLNTRLG